MYGFASRAFRLGWCGQERALRKSETIINAELSDLDKSIILKEALLAQIKEGQASYETMQQVGGERGCIASRPSLQHAVAIYSQSI